MNDDAILARAPIARNIVKAVHTRDPEKVHDHLAHLDREGLHAVILLLSDVVGEAAADALDALVGKDEHGVPRLREAWTDEELRQAHAAWTRREDTPWSRAGEREYQRRRYIRRAAIAAKERQILEQRKARTAA